MCEQGMNVGQLKLSVAQVEEMLGLAQEWLEQLHRLADRGHKTEASVKLAQVTVALGESRNMLEEAIERLEDRGDDKVSVELV